VFSGFQLVGTTEPFSWRVFPSAPFPGALDADGFPKPQAFNFSNVPSALEYFGASFNSADAMASGSVQPQ
jgi:hypothetical protein